MVPMPPSITIWLFEKALENRIAEYSLFGRFYHDPTRARNANGRFADEKATEEHISRRQSAFFALLKRGVDDSLTFQQFWIGQILLKAAWNTAAK